MPRRTERTEDYVKKSVRRQMNGYGDQLQLSVTRSRGFRLSVPTQVIKGVPFHAIVVRDKNPQSVIRQSLELLRECVETHHKSQQPQTPSQGANQ
jgi:hypothetical protein